MTTIQNPVAAEILNQAEQYANTILQGSLTAAAEPISNTQGSLGTRTVHHYYHHDPIWFYNPRPVVHVSCPATSPAPAPSTSSSSSSSKSKKGDDLLTALAIAAVFVGISAAIGATVRELHKAKDQIENLDVQQSLAVTEGTGPSVEKVVEQQKKMLRTQHGQDVDRFWTLGKMAGCTAAAGFGLYASPLIFGASVLAGVGYTAKKIFNQGEVDGDPSMKEEALRLLKSVQEARIAIKA